MSLARHLAIARALAAPSVVKAEAIMPVKAVPPDPFGFMHFFDGERLVDTLRLPLVGRDPGRLHFRTTLVWGAGIAGPFTRATFDPGTALPGYRDGPEPMRLYRDGWARNPDRQEQMSMPCLPWARNIVDVTMLEDP